MSVERLGVKPNPSHPAKFSWAVLDVLQRLIDSERRRLKRPPLVLDPFCGVGRIHSLEHCDTVGVEIEADWAACHHRTEVGDATALRFQAGAFDAVMCSPVYPGRMTDHHDNRDSHKACAGKGCRACNGTGISPRKNYRVALGRMPSEGSAAVMGWGAPYRILHRTAAAEMVRVVAPGGMIAINMSDSIGGGKVIPAVDWWRWTMEDVGLKITRVLPVQTPRMLAGANRELRAEHEVVIVARKPR